MDNVLYGALKSTLMTGLNVLSKGFDNTGTVSIVDKMNVLSTLYPSAETTLYFPDGTYKIGANYTMEDNFTITRSAGAKFVVDTGVTFNLGSCKIADSNLTEFFSGDGTVSGTPISDKFYPEWFGAIGDDSTDDFNSINKFLTFLSGLSNPYAIFNENKTYLVTNSLVASGSINLLIKGTINTSVSSGVALKINGDGDLRKKYIIDIKRTSQSDWSDSTLLGVQFVNISNSKIEIKQSRGFYFGCEFRGDSKGFAYNEVKLNYLLANKYALKLTNINLGWCNENIYLGGRFASFSNTNPNESRYGVIITSEDGLYVNNNNNVFKKPSFELDIPDVGVAIPIIIEYGSFNTFENMRNEGNSSPTIKTFNDSNYNSFSSGYGILTIEESDTSSNNTINSINNKRSEKLNIPIYKSGHLPKNTVEYNSTGSVNVKNVNLFASFNNTSYKGIGSITKNDNYLEMEGGRGLGCFISTEITKEFCIRTDAEIGFGGRINIQCYDSLGNVLTDLGANHPYVNLSLYSSSFGGVYRTSSDSNNNLTLRAHDDVKYIKVLICGGTSVLRIRSFSISTDSLFDSEYFLSHTRYNDNFATEIPTTLTYKLGDIIYNDSPSAGGYVGWICTVAGTPGTWKGFGLIEV